MIPKACPEKDTKHQYFEDEIKTSRRLNHPHILKMYETFQSRQHDFILMEYSSGGQLQSHLDNHKALTEDQARQVMSQMLGALAYLHHNNICHRDIKPENIML